MVRTSDWRLSRETLELMWKLPSILRSLKAWMILLSKHFMNNASQMSVHGTLARSVPLHPTHHQYFCLYSVLEQGR